MQLEGIDHVAVGVRDIEQSAKCISKFSGSSDFMKACGTVSRLSSAREIPELRYSPRTRMQNRHRQVTAKLRMLHLAFRANRENFVAHRANWKSAESASIPESRNFALHLFPRSRRPPTGDHYLRIARVVLICHVGRSFPPQRDRYSRRS